MIQILSLQKRKYTQSNDNKLKGIDGKSTDANIIMCILTMFEL